MAILHFLTHYRLSRFLQIAEFAACDHLNDQISDRCALRRSRKDLKSRRLGGERVQILVLAAAADDIDRFEQFQLHL